MLTWRFDFSRVHVLFLSCPRVLEPNLGHPFTQSGDLGDPLQILTVRIRVQLKICLQHLQLLLRERGADTFRLVLVVALRITTVCESKHIISWLINGLRLMAYRPRKSCRRRGSRDSGPCTAPGPRGGRTPRRWRVAGGRRRTRSTPDDRRGLWPSAPNRWTRCRGRTPNTWLRNFWNERDYMKQQLHTFEELILSKELRKQRHNVRKQPLIGTLIFCLSLLNETNVWVDWKEIGTNSDTQTKQQFIITI